MASAVSGSSESANWLSPIEIEAGAGEFVVAIARAFAMAGDVRGMGGNFIGDDALLDVFAVGQAEVFFRRDVAEHGSAVPADHGRANRGGDVIVAGSDIGDQRSQSIEGRFVAHLFFFFDLQSDLIERDVSRTFDHDLHIVLPGFFGQFAERFELGELRGIAGIGQTAGAQAVAEGKAHIVFLENFADGVEVFVEQVLLVILHHPFGENRAAAADDAGNAVLGQRHILNQHARVNGHVIHALLGLLFDDFEHDLDVQIFHAADAIQRFVDGHRADGHRRGIDDGLPDCGISPPVERSMTVSAPYFTAYCNLASSSSIFDVVAEFPMLALILHLD